MAKYCTAANKRKLLFLLL